MEQRPPAALPASATSDRQRGGPWPKFYAVLATRRGQEEVLNRIKDLDKGAPWRPGLPHHGPKAIVIVTLG
jgi:hypothetical protein